jgi:hypothetical protein
MDVIGLFKCMGKTLYFCASSLHRENISPEKAW